MIITNATTNNYFKNTYRKTIYTNRNKSVSLSFGNKVSIPNNFVTKFLEASYRKAQSVTRLLRNMAINNKKNNAQAALLQEKLSKLDENSPEYIKVLTKFGKNLGKNREVEINLESNRIRNLANSDEACIFIMNHDNRKHDSAMLSIFNTLLSDAYIKAGKTSTCPRPKFIINEDTLSAMNPNLRQLFKKLGAVGIDSSILTPDASKNTRKMIPIMRAFNRDKANVFIFPEGSLRILKGLDMEYKFQTGVAEMVNAIAGTKKSVKVVPVGFAYNEKSKQFLGSIYVGEPVYFRRQDKNVEFSEGNMHSNLTSKHYVDFINEHTATEDGYRTVIKQSQPVIDRDLSDYVAGILCENLRICKEEAKKQLPQKSLGDKIIKL